MPVVVDFNGRIDSKKQWDFDRSAVNAVNGQRHLLLRLQFRIESIQIETFFRSVVDFNGRIDSKKQWDFDRSAVNAVNGQRHLLLRLQFRIESIQIETFFAGKPKRLRAMLCCELQRQYAHADQI